VRSTLLVSFLSALRWWCQVAGRAHGLGTQVIVGRDTYTGEFVRDLRQGRGVCVYANGCRWVPLLGCCPPPSLRAPRANQAIAWCYLLWMLRWHLLANS
jgi:hypothetical protein